MDAVWAKLGAVYNKLIPIMTATCEDVKTIPHRLKDLYDSLVVIHGDAKTFFEATAAVSGLCRQVEAKLIAADQMRVYCTRINNAMGPFESLLDELGVHPDPSKACWRRHELLRPADAPPGPQRATGYATYQRH